MRKHKTVGRCTNPLKSVILGVSSECGGRVWLPRKRGRMQRLDSFGRKISECRQNMNMTQEELAGRIGVTPQALSKWERGVSFPDITLLAELCQVLQTSADYLLGVEKQLIMEDGRSEDWKEVFTNLQRCLEPVVLIFSQELVPLFVDNSFVDEVVTLRKDLAKDGILLPVVRIMDDVNLEPGEFMVLAYQNVLFSETLERIEFGTTMEYIMSRLGEVVRGQYYEILNPDIMKQLTDNLEERSPALISGIVPERISYGLLTEVMKGFLRRGNSMAYLEKVIEYTESELRKNPQESVERLIELVSGRIERSDNYWIIIKERFD